MQVMFVGSQTDLLNTYVKELERLGIVGVRIEQARQAFDYLEWTPVKVVVSELSLPDMSGLAFLRRLQADHPEVYRVLLSATYPESEELQNALQSRLVEQYFHRHDDWWALRDYFARFADYACHLKPLHGTLSSDAGAVDTKLNGI